MRYRERGEKEGGSEDSAPGAEREGIIWRISQPGAFNIRALSGSAGAGITSGYKGRVRIAVVLRRLTSYSR
jgi:hypothetical protein